MPRRKLPHRKRNIIPKDPKEHKRYKLTEDQYQVLKILLNNPMLLANGYFKQIIDIVKQGEYNEYEKAMLTELRKQHYDLIKQELNKQINTSADNDWLLKYVKSQQDSMDFLKRIGNTNNPISAHPDMNKRNKK